jgi:hypothetical protein
MVIMTALDIIVIPFIGVFLGPLHTDLFEIHQNHQTYTSEFVKTFLNVACFVYLFLVVFANSLSIWKETY